jgi:hypothetical protein
MGPGEFDGPKQESSNGTAHTQNRSSAAHQPSGNFTMARRSAAVRTRESNPASYLHESTDAACGSGGLIRTVHPTRNLSASMYFDHRPCNSFKSLYRRSGPRPRFSQFCTVRGVTSSAASVSRETLFFTSENHPRVQNLLDLSFIKADGGSPGAELADDPSKLCCLVIIVRVSIDNDMERVVARHLPESGPQSRRRFGAL